MNCSEGKEGSQGGGKATDVLTACDKDLAIKRPVMSNRGQQKMRTDNQGFEVVAATFGRFRVGRAARAVHNQQRRQMEMERRREGRVCVQPSRTTGWRSLYL